MPRSTHHRDGRRTGSISPLSAATLLLLVSMVVATSPAATRASTVPAPEARTQPVRLLVVGESDTDAAVSSAYKPQNQVPRGGTGPSIREPLEPCIWQPLVAPDLGGIRCARVRTALLDLPPPIV